MKRFLHLLAAIGLLCACIQRKPADPVKKELGARKTEPARTEPAVEIRRVLCNELHFRFHVIQKTNGTWIVGPTQRLAGELGVEILPRRPQGNLRRARLCGASFHPIPGDRAVTVGRDQPRFRLEMTRYPTRQGDR